MKHIVNFFITAGLIWLFQLTGWIKIVQEVAPFQSPVANQLLVAGIVGLIFTVGMWLAGLAFTFLIVGTCGIGCFLYPVYLAFLGPAGFWLVVKLLPGWIEVTANTWQIILMGIVIAMVRLHPRSASSSSSSTQSA